MLDVSEQGLRFRATTPTESLAPIHFSFSAHSDLVEGVAELAWTDQANKTGGLRFTELSDDAREVIRKWPHESDLELSVGEDFMLHMPASDESRSGARGRGVFDATLQFASRFGSHFKVQKHSFLGLLAIAIAVILVSSFSYVRHREVGEWLVRVGTRISGEAPLQTARQVPPSTLSVQPPDASEVSGDKSNLAPAQEQAGPQTTKAAPPAIAAGNATGPSTPKAPTGNVRPSTPAASGRDLVVQVAALTREADARELADSLRQKNFQAFVRTRPADALYRVMLGPYANTAAARVEVDKLKRAGFDSFVRREPGPELSGSLRITNP